jgi:hypothetical protein
MKIKIREDGLTAGTCLQAAFFVFQGRKQKKHKKKREREKKKGKPLTFSDFLEKKFPR